MTAETKTAPGCDRGPKNTEHIEGATMSDTDATALYRATDPDTSRAAVPTPEQRGLQKAAILHLLTEVGPMTDHELTYQYTQQRARNGWPATQADSVRKRRAELMREGRVVSTGRTSGFALGHAPSTIWAAA